MRQSQRNLFSSRNTKWIGMVLVGLFVAPRVNAMTNVIFKQDGSQATVVLMGMPGDPDPAGLFQALRMAPEDFNGKWAKKLSLNNADGSHAFDIDCVFSKVIQDNGTCTVIFRVTPELISVSRSEGKARLWLSGDAAVGFAEAFQVREESTVIFRSKDGKLNVTVARDRGVITDLVVDWNGRGVL